MRRSALVLLLAAGGLAACSSSAKSGSAGNAVAPTAASTTTTTVVQAEQTVPARTTFVVDGQKVGLDCRGHGRIPVVFLAGGRAPGGALWNGMVTALGDKVFTCVFDRPGTTADAINEPPSRLATPSNVAASLAATLRQASIGPRVVVVGHSAGGDSALVFGARDPELVAGAVLFDPTVPQQIPDTEWARIGFDGTGTVRDVRAVTSWPDLPLVILTADSKLVVVNKEATAAEEGAWIAAHKRWASLSSKGVQREVPNTSHAVYLSAPKASADAIREVLRQAS